MLHPSAMFQESTHLTKLPLVRVKAQFRASLASGSVTPVSEIHPGLLIEIIYTAAICGVSEPEQDALCGCASGFRTPKADSGRDTGKSVHDAPTILLAHFQGT